MCPVHTLREMVTVQRRARRCKVFTMSPGTFTKKLRQHTWVAGLPRADKRCSHEFRRGTARQMVKNGSNLAGILRAGDWSSAAYAEYLDQDYIDQPELLEIIADQESDDDQPKSTASAQAAGAKAPGSGSRKRAGTATGSRLLTEFFSLTQPR